MTLTLIPTEELEEYKPYASNFRGDTLEDKVDHMIQRYAKIVKDCEGDDSDYRTHFMDTHAYALEVLSERENKQDALAEVAIENFGYYRLVMMKTQIDKDAAHKNKYMIASEYAARAHGLLDASAIIALEASRLLGWW